jgi:soluble P-type ATPase
VIETDIPGFGPLRLAHLVSDYNGTLSVDGRLWPGVKDALARLAAHLDIHIVTADTFGRARSELQGLDCALHILRAGAEDVQKEDLLRRLGAEAVVALGNGNNDRRMLRASRVGIAVCLHEGCAVSALTAADLVVASPLDALDLCLSPERLKATLRF